MRLMTLLLALGLLWPVAPPPPEILRGWQPPAGPYAPGHRGVDLAAPPNTPVLAPTAGTVTFAGPVGGRGVLTLTLPATGTPPLRTTFSPVTPLVRAGTRVRPGTLLARVAPNSHCPENCLHWGLLRGTTYLNPLLLTRRPPSRLLPPADRGVRGEGDISAGGLGTRGPGAAAGRTSGVSFGER